MRKLLCALLFSVMLVQTCAGLAFFDKKSIAVLYIDNGSDNSEIDGDTVVDLLIAGLKDNGRFKVIDGDRRNWLPQNGRSGQTASSTNAVAYGRYLQCNYVITGRITKAKMVSDAFGDHAQVQISYRVIDAGSGEVVYTVKEDGEGSNLDLIGVHDPDDSDRYNAAAKNSVKRAVSDIAFKLAF